MSRESLERILDKASEADWETANQAWWRYHAIVKEVAERHGFTVEIGAAVFSALSPNSDYLGNLRDTYRLLAATAAGKRLDEFKVSTYGSNKRKAWRIAHGEKPLDLIVFPKTRNFFMNVRDPADTAPVTVDGHIFNVWAGRRIPLNSAEMKGNQKLYDEVADSIRQIGAERRILPNVVQASLWFTWKRLHSIKHTSQGEFWQSDYLSAGLGFRMERELAA